MQVIKRPNLHVETGFRTGEVVGIDYPYYARRSIAVGTVTRVDDTGRILDFHFEKWVGRKDIPTTTREGGEQQ